MTSIQTLLITKLSKYLPWLERFFLATVLLGASLNFSGIDAINIIFVSLSGLSVVYFLNAFRLPSEEESPDSQQELMGFADLLASLIIPKVLWISCSVSTIGTLFYILHFEGHKEMIMIGGSSIITGLILLGFIFIGGTKHLRNLQPVLMRALPIGVIAAYIFFR